MSRAIETTSRTGCRSPESPGECSGTIVLAIDGPFDSVATAELRPRFMAVLRETGGDVVLDLTTSNFMDGSGIGAIGFLFKRLAARGSRLTVIGATGQPREMLAGLQLEAPLGLRPYAAPHVTAAAMKLPGVKLPGTKLPGMKLGQVGLSRFSSSR